MLRAGDLSYRVRRGMGTLGTALGIEALAVHISLGSLSATARRGGEQVTLVSEVAPLGVNTRRMGALEHLAQTAEQGVSAQAVAARLDAIEAEPPVHRFATLMAAGGMACGSFSFLNGGGPLEVLASLLGGAIGQAIRLLLSRGRFNQYAVTALCAVIASSAYCLVATILGHTGFAVPRHAAGFISSVLFLVPGFPLIAAMVDLLHQQMACGISRMVYGGMILVGAAFGVSLVCAVAGLTAQTPPPLLLSEPATLLLRAVASVVGGCSFAIMYNSSWRIVQVVGGLSLIGNELRLALHDSGIPLAPASFAGGLTVGMLSSLVLRRFHEPRTALTVPSIIIMVPGTYAFQAVIFFNQGDLQSGLQASFLCCSVVGAMALGLAVARFATVQEGRRES